MEYQWNINQTENMFEMGSPLGGRTGAAGAAEVRHGRRSCLGSADPDAGRAGGLPRRPPVQGSGERQ